MKRKTKIRVKKEHKKAKGVHTILERTFTKLSGFLLELFDCSLVNATTLVDEMTSGGRFS
jgi:hypothetical protein